MCDFLPVNSAGIGSIMRYRRKGQKKSRLGRIKILIVVSCCCLSAGTIVCGLVAACGCEGLAESSAAYRLVKQVQAKNAHTARFLLIMGFGK